MSEATLIRQRNVREAPRLLAHIYYEMLMNPSRGLRQQVHKTLEWKVLLPDSSTSIPLAGQQECADPAANRWGRVWLNRQVTWSRGSDVRVSVTPAPGSVSVTHAVQGREVTQPLMQHEHKTHKWVKRNEKRSS
ncbi:unnamed protein product [Pleuronectes platessa]|uniref:Uncharacterized protein n=1 Tax=Pleuronectes platessa TaxID=8262 RepID=A0A9N7VJ23_PLEPL|nr:unnamed protein product [Pleuronectes platessa]